MDDKDYRVHFGDWLKRRRKSLDLTQEELAQRAGCSVFNLRKIEAGDRKPSKQLAGLIAQALEIPQADQTTFITMARGERAAFRVPLPSLAKASITPPPPPAASPLNKLPLLLTPLIGRDAEVQALQQMLQNPACRLLTLVGPGGIGKTCLAIEVASHYQDLFPSGVCFIPLASLNSSAFLIPAISDALGLSLSSPFDPKEQLLSFLIDLARQPFMLVLDNLEHLLVPREGENRNTGTTILLQELLQRVTNLKLMVTSRERMYLRGEWTFELEGLPVPVVGQLNEFEKSSAVRLFIQRASQVNKEFPLTPEERLAVVQICQIVEGSPLAIELAAAWTNILSCSEIAREIESNMDFLATTMRDIPERHRSMRATFDHSWRLLSDEERRLLGELSVFQEGFLREAAEKVTSATLPLLASLVSKSLLQRKENGRFGFHEMIRQYALSHFVNDPYYETVKDKHSEFYLVFMVGCEKALRGSVQQQAIRELTGEIGNVRTALAWARKGKNLALLGQAIQSFGWFCDIRGWLREGIEQGELAEQVLRARPESEERQIALGLVLGVQGLLYFRQGQFNRARALLEESLDLLCPVGDLSLLPDKLIIYGVILFLSGENDRAKNYIHKGLACAQSMEDSWHEALGLLNLGLLDDIAGKYNEAYDQIRAGLTKWRTLGDQRMVALALNFLSPTIIRLGRYDEANALLQESLTLTTQLGDRWGVGTAYRCLGMLALAQGNALQAESLTNISLAIFTDLDARWDIARALNTLGDAKATTNELPEARQTFLKAIRLSIEAHTSPLIFDSLNGIAYLHKLESEAEQALEISIYVMSHPISTFEAKERAKQLSLELKAQLTSQQIEMVEARALGISFDERMVGILSEQDGGEVCFYHPS
jgi:predicted ATPase/transcriptional regulator with XRE-family HTH domain